MKLETTQQSGHFLEFFEIRLKAPLSQNSIFLMNEFLSRYGQLGQLGVASFVNISVTYRDLRS